MISSRTNNCATAELLGVNNKTLDRGLPTLLHSNCLRQKARRNGQGKVDAVLEYITTARSHVARQQYAYAALVEIEREIGDDDDEADDSPPPPLSASSISVARATAAPTRWWHGGGGSGAKAGGGGGGGGGGGTGGGTRDGGCGGGNGDSSESCDESDSDSDDSDSDDVAEEDEDEQRLPARVDGAAARDRMSVAGREAWRMQYAIMSDGGVLQLKKKLTCVWVVLQQRSRDLQKYATQVLEAAKQQHGHPWPRVPGVSAAVKRATSKWSSTHGLQYPKAPSQSSMRRHFTRWAKTGEFNVERPGPKSGQQW